MDLLPALLAVSVLAALLGVELCVGVFFHPVLDRLDDIAWALARAHSADRLGRVMPGWYVAALFGAVLSSIIALSAGDGLAAAGWSMCSLALAAVIIVTVSRLVPLNSTLVNGGAADDRGEVASLRRTAERWDRLHRGRIAALAAVLVLEIMISVT